MGAEPCDGNALSHLRICTPCVCVLFVCFDTSKYEPRTLRSSAVRLTLSPAMFAIRCAYCIDSAVRPSLHYITHNETPQEAVNRLYRDTSVGWRRGVVVSGVRHERS